MRKSLLAVFAIFVMLTVAIPMASCADGDNDLANAEWSFEGQIMHDNVLKKSPHKVEITISDESSTIIGTFDDYLGTQGEFKVDIKNGVTISSGKTYNIKITEYGYSVATKPTEMLKQPDGTFNITLTDAHINVETKTVTLTLYESYISMGKSTSTLKGTVVSSSGDKVPLNGVKITLTSVSETEKKTITVFSQYDGTFRFDNLNIGEYKLVAESKGFDQYIHSGTVVVEPNMETTVGIEMTPSGNIDISHWMTIIGGILAITVLVAVTGFIVKSKKKKI